MKEIKFRAWVKGSVMADWETITKECDRFSLLKDSNFLFMQFSGLQDSKGVDIYAGDIVYFAGFGDFTVEFPFIELYEAAAENDIGEIKGNIYESHEQSQEG